MTTRRSHPYEGPIITTDAVVLRFVDDQLLVLTHTRPREPFAGQAALPGVYVSAGETIMAATERCLASKTGLTLPETSFRHVLGVRDSVGRDPRGHAISIVVIVVLPSGHLVPEQTWQPVHEVQHLAFDHNAIVEAALMWLDANLWMQRDLMAALLDNLPLTTSTFVALQSAVSGTDAAIDISNLRRKISASGFFRATRKRSAPTGRGRPSAVWTWKQPGKRARRAAMNERSR